jgi:hypothetical protein
MSAAPLSPVAPQVGRSERSERSISLCVPPRVVLIAKRNHDRDRPDYGIFAGPQLVGRIYQHYRASTSETWWWGLNTITFDSTVGDPMKGYADSLPKARAAFREAFDRYLAWGLALPQWDPKKAVVAAQLKKMGAA